MRCAMFIFLLVATCCGACRPMAIDTGRDGLSSSECSMVKSLRHAPPDEAAGLRRDLSKSAGAMSAAVEKGELVEGMSPADALRAWGEPDIALRPWVTNTKTEFWYYRARDLPDIEVDWREGKVESVRYRAKGRVPQVPRGSTGWLKRWPAPGELNDSRW